MDGLLDFHRLMSGAKGPLGLLHFPAQLLNGALVLGHVLTSVGLMAQGGPSKRQ